MPNRSHLRPRLAALFLLVALAACDTVGLAPQPAATGDRQPTPAQSPLATGAVPPQSAFDAGVAQRDAADYAAAAESFAAALRADPAGPQARLAGLYLAESLGRQQRWAEAAEVLRPLAEAQQGDDIHARALFMLARAYEEAGAWADAAAAYERYRALGTPIEPYARMRQAAQERALGRDAEAAAGYESVAASDIVPAERAAAYEHAIELRTSLGQGAQALELYRRLLDLAEDPAYRARLLVAAASLARAQGQADQAREWLVAAVAEAPGAAEGLDAAQQLLADSPDALPPAAAARVYAAHERWDAAIPLFDDAIAVVTGTERLALRRERALAVRAQGDFAGAMAELAGVGAADPDGEAGRQAQLDWVQTVGQSGDTARAIAGYREYAAAYPADPRAPVALSRAVILLEGQGDAEGAAQQRLDFARRYPAAADADRALFLAGMHFYSGGRLDEALGAWDELGRRSPGVAAAQAAYWKSRAVRSGAAAGESAEELLDVAREAAPDSFYAARADELAGEAPQGSVPIGAPIGQEEWRAAEEWLGGWSGAPLYSLAERGYQLEVAQDPAVLRAAALADVGLVSESIAEWRVPLARWHDDPLKQYLLARLADEHDVTYVAILAAERLVALSPGGAGEAPPALRRLIFPTPYRQIVLEQARIHGVDPLALYALLRQESYFNPAATSWVGARGLAQVMPSTAQGIAQALGVADFQDGDLYRPEVSIRFGAFYLRRQLESIGGSLPGALAAYNGGLGNAWRWAGGETVADPDLFAEQIDFAETRSYVKLVYGYHGAYRRIYRAE